MEKMNMKKYFEFSGYVSGLTFLLRNILSTLLSFVGGFMAGWGWSQSFPIFVLGIVSLYYILRFSFANIYKRINSVDPKNMKIWMPLFVIFSIISFFDDGSPFFNVTNLMSVIFTLYFVFQNGQKQDTKNNNLNG
jgi:uncharacterized membrane protein YhaH (DUF805 family)